MRSELPAISTRQFLDLLYKLENNPLYADCNRRVNNMDSYNWGGNWRNLGKSKKPIKNWDAKSKNSSNHIIPAVNLSRRTPTPAMQTEAQRKAKTNPKEGSMAGTETGDDYVNDWLICYICKN